MNAPDLSMHRLRFVLIYTPTTILTFLLVAALQNSQRRAEVAMQKKLDALADGLADLMEHFLHGDEKEKQENLAGDVRDLICSVSIRTSGDTRRSSRRIPQALDH